MILKSIHRICSFANNRAFAKDFQIIDTSKYLFRNLFELFRISKYQRIYLVRIGSSEKSPMTGMATEMEQDGKENEKIGNYQGNNKCGPRRVVYRAFG